MTIHTYAGPLIITLVYVAIYYGAIINILRVKNRLAREGGPSFDRYQSTDKQMLTADRIQLNQLEHMPAFLVLLWLDAVLVPGGHATHLGAVYLLTRIVYPFVLGRAIGRGAPTRILPVTFTGYGVLMLISAELIWALVTTG